MFALSEYYIGLFGFLVENDGLENGEGGWGWALHLSGSDLPWEEIEDNNQSRSQKLNDVNGSSSKKIGSAAKLEGLRALERSSMESMGSLKDEPAHLSEHDAKANSAATAAAAAAEAEEEALWLLNFKPSNHKLDRIASSSSSSARAASPTSVIKSVMRKASDALQREGKSSTSSTFSIWDGLTGSVMQVKREAKRVKFCTTAQCVLIPSRSDLQTQGIDELLWFSESVLEQSKREAQDELQKTLATNSSSLSLYAAMNLLYRPCIKGSNDRRDHFRMLVVDDSTVARRMFIHTIVSGHKASGTKEHLYVHQADSYKSALESIQLHSYNLIVVDEYLSPFGETEVNYGSDIIRLARQQFENCVLIAISSCLDLNDANTELGRETKKRMQSSGADIVLRKPSPLDTWQRLVACLPLEF